MSEHTRRNFLRSSVGAAAVGAAAVVVPFGSSANAAPATDAHPLDSGPAHAGSFHVWVKDADAGKIAVLVGESEVVYTDRKLAKRLARIAARAQS